MKPRPASRGTSAAVMARRAEPALSLDFFPTPPWATRALCEHVLPQVWPYPDVWRGEALDPCCGEGHMAAALAEYFHRVAAADVFPYGFGRVLDFLEGDDETVPTEWVVMNPPFNRAEAFIEKALAIAVRGVAVLVRTAFLEGQARHRALYARRPPQLVMQFVERVAMHRGRWVPNGKTATAYCWIVWLKNVPHNWQHTRFGWIPPCKKWLTRQDDAHRFAAAGPAPLLATPQTDPMDALKRELGALL